MTRATRATRNTTAQIVDGIAGKERLFAKPPNAPLTFPLPRQGEEDPFFRCTRGYWNDLILPNARNNFRPPVRSIVDRTRNSNRRDGKTARGKRLIVYDSALDYFNRLAAESTEPEAA